MIQKYTENMRCTLKNSRENQVPLNNIGSQVCKAVIELTHNCDIKLYRHLRKETSKELLSPSNKTYSLIVPTKETEN